MYHKEKREDIPEHTPPKMAHLISICWQQHDDGRPTIEAAVQTLKEEHRLLFFAQPNAAESPVEEPYPVQDGEKENGKGKEKEAEINNEKGGLECVY